MIYNWRLTSLASNLGFYDLRGICGRGCLTYTLMHVQAEIERIWRCCAFLWALRKPQLTDAKTSIVDGFQIKTLRWAGVGFSIGACWHPHRYYLFCLRLKPSAGVRLCSLASGDSAVGGAVWAFCITARISVYLSKASSALSARGWLKRALIQLPFSRPRNRGKNNPLFVVSQSRQRFMAGVGVMVGASP